MKIFKRKEQQIDVPELILKELQAIHNEISTIKEHCQTSNWDSLSKDSDIKKLKEKNKNLRKEIKELKKC